MLIFDQLYINGQWVAPHGSGCLDVINASTEAVMGRIPQGNEQDADAAVRAARAAFEAWALTSPAERAAILNRVGDGLQARLPELARLVAGEVGMPLKLAGPIQIGTPIANFKSYAQMLDGMAWSERIGHSTVLREPVGVVAAITPWNYPLHQIAAKVAPALAAGCTVVLKPSEVAPLNAFVLAQILHEAGVPPGVFNLVSGTGLAVGEALVSHPEIDMVSFTGSTRAGRRISELAAATIKRVSLELGGKSASVILPSADLPAAVKGTVNACFLNSGQTCSAHTRMLVHESQYEQAARLAVDAARRFTVGDPLGDTAKLGPLVSAAQRERVRSYITQAVAEGAELLCGGADAPADLPTGYYVQPTVLGRVQPHHTVAQEEVFGPVLAILTYRDDADAVAIANGTIYGLGGAVWAGTDAQAEHLARRLRTGQVDINGGGFNLGAPFGGYKQSGHGREMGRWGLEEFLETKALQFRA